MSVKVNSNHSKRTLDIINTGDSVTFHFDTAGDRYADRISADRAEFIRAIETELDVTVINGPLPSVRVDQSGTTSSLIANTFSGRSIARYVTEDPTRRRAIALAEEAIARHLEANPPVDDDAVNALAELVRDVDKAEQTATSDGWAALVARRLVRAGVRAPEETNKDGAR